MNSPIPESDWKKLRPIREIALQRFCKQTLLELRGMLYESEQLVHAHETYLKVYQYLHDEDKKLGSLFDDWRRSTVHITLMGWLREGLLTEDEFHSLSEETKSLMRERTDITYYQS